MVDSVPGLVAVLQKYQLLEAEQLAEVDQLQHRHTDPRLLAKELLHRGWLTPYQINQIFLGRSADLVLGSYLLLQRVGEGSMGQVFRARHQKLGRIVALKVIRKDRIAQPNALKRFLREVEAVARLSHPNIVLAFDADEAGHFLVMEFIEGTDLAKLVKQNGPLPVWQACDYIRQAAQGLQHAYKCGVVHRDIKPSNLLVTTTVVEPSKAALPQDADRAGGCLVAVVKLLDLGLVRLQDPDDGPARSALTQLQTILGTPDYIAPEQARDARAADIRSDLYSLGCSFYFLLTGRVPFAGETRMDKVLKHCQEEPEPVEEVRRSVLAAERANLTGYGPDSPVEDEVPRAVAAVVHKLMAKRPEDRYQTASEVVQVLTDLIPKGIRLAIPAEAFVPSSLPPGPPPEIDLWAALTSRQGIALMVAVGAVFVALVVLLLLALLLPGPKAGRSRGGDARRGDFLAAGHRMTPSPARAPAGDDPEPRGPLHHATDVDLAETGLRASSPGRCDPAAL
jgi:serine/threonine-protein kinase